MAIFKCKMCGGALEINTNETVATGSNVFGQCNVSDWDLF